MDFISRMKFLVKARGRGQRYSSRNSKSVSVRKHLEVGITVCYQLHVLLSSDQRDKIVLPPSHGTTLLPELLFYPSVVSHESFGRSAFVLLQNRSPLEIWELSRTRDRFLPSLPSVLLSGYELPWQPRSRQTVFPCCRVFYEHSSVRNALI